MKVILLDGSAADDPVGGRVCAALAAQFQARGWAVEHVVLRDKKLANCAGDFFCWVRTPGVCHANDDNNAIASAVVASDVLVYATPVTFGGYSSALKRIVDRLIQTLSPFFTTVAGETRHEPRYRKYPDLLAVGWMDGPDAQAEAVFKHLVHCNAVNIHTKTCVCEVVSAGRSDAEMQVSARVWLDDLARGRSSAPVGLPVDGKRGGPAAIRRAVLLVGSPRTRKSTSNSLGGYLFGRLGPSTQVETVYLHTVLRSPAKRQALLDAVDAADLVALAFPVYFDSLPAAAVEALELIAAHRQGRAARPPLFVAIANCGFPEAGQAATALAICAAFARRAGFAWGGGLALGGGELVGGVPLLEGGMRTLRIRRSLDLAAAALAQGQAIPQAAQDGLQKPLIPHWLYRLVGGFIWRHRAKRYGAEKRLRQQPYGEGR